VSTTSLFEQALSLCVTADEREKLQWLAVRLHLDENAQEWAVLVLHAEARGLFDTVEQRRVDFAAQNDRIEERLRHIEERLDRTATVVVQQLNGKATNANWWPPATNELLAFAFGGAFVAILFCAILMAKISPPPLAFIGTVIATLLLTAVVMWAMSSWRAGVRVSSATDLTIKLERRNGKTRILGLLRPRKRSPASKIDGETLT
jgi:hypothetical protein